MFLTFIPREEREPFGKIGALLEQLRKARYIQTWRFTDTQLGVDVEVYPATSSGVIERGGYDKYIEELKQKLGTVKLDLYEPPKLPDEVA